MLSEPSSLRSAVEMMLQLLILVSVSVDLGAMGLPEVSSVEIRKRDTGSAHDHNN